MKIIDANTVSVEATFTEPVLPAGQNPLSYYYIQYQVGAGAPVLGPHIPSNPGGNENVAYTLVLPAPDGQVTQFTLGAFAVDASGKPSAESNIVNFTVNRTAPPAPISFSVA